MKAELQMEDKLNLFKFLKCASKLENLDENCQKQLKGEQENVWITFFQLSFYNVPNSPRGELCKACFFNDVYHLNVIKIPMFQQTFQLFWKFN